MDPPPDSAIFLVVMRTPEQPVIWFLMQFDTAIEHEHPKKIAR